MSVYTSLTIVRVNEYMYYFCFVENEEMGVVLLSFHACNGTLTSV